MKKWQLENIVSSCKKEKLGLPAVKSRSESAGVEEIACERIKVGAIRKISQRVVACLVRVF